ncbi:redoxin domain-containing protein [Halomicroarcula sp. F13]|uniref:Redoxin domain-containing protein n=1 Tax=Haloarcula rubra TaxID=2487747 RepID=A0AAW4PPS1_9EURY|nr:redoxin domain-containing protein [Halomicroarcula rubra]MBX0322674.1 redoxin domain-containing protein [Halomicroarcula rubra]
MIGEGTVAPTFELPALVDGERRRVALDEYVGDDVVILAFYPADFNQACDEASCDLDELDLFTMQKDVTILGISPDSVYSHRAFADRYDLKVPLLADTAGDVAEQYDLTMVDDIGQRLVERAVAVVDHDGVVRYAWHTDDPTELPRVDELKDAIADTGGDDTAFARYRIGHAHYTEGRRAFTAAMNEFGDSEWMLAQSDFQRAREEFEEAEAQFDTAVRFGDDASLAPIYDGARTKASSLWQAADWLTQAASAYSSGSGAEGQDLRDDAERPLETARGYEEPPDPDGEWPPAEDDLEKAPDELSTILPTDPDPDDVALGVDIDDEMAEADDTEAETTASADTTDDATATSDPGTAASADGDDEGDDEIGDDELAEIQAELAASNPDTEPPTEAVTEEPTTMVETLPGEAEAEADAEDGEDAPGDDAAAVDGDLDLTDPVAGEREADGDDDD